MDDWMADPAVTVPVNLVLLLLTNSLCIYAWNHPSYLF